MMLLNIITSIHLIVFFSLLFFRKQNPLPNKILGLLLLNPAVNFISNVNILAGNLEHAPYIFFFAQATAGLFAPLVYIYVRLMIGKKLNFLQPIFLSTFIFLLAVICFTIEYAFLLSPDEQGLYLQGILHGPYPVQMELVNAIFILAQQLYFTVAAIQIYKYKQSLSNILSSFEKTKLRYISRFIALIWLLNLIAIVTYATLPATLVEYIVLPCVMTVICFFILYFSFHHNSIFTTDTYRAFLSDSEKAAHSATLPPPPAEMTDPGTIAEGSIEQTASLILQFLKEKEPFANPDISLSMLSSRMQLPESRVSLAINKGLNKTFYDLINEARIRKAQRLLMERKELSVEGVAYESGFNSRASFYRAYKKYTGKTPSQFLSGSSAS